ncbi:hypothetical protein J6590_029228 [Homalodisca vitripennis]|nr:hypothetical protein J6590_029228 [Homalodisca vitripennis]
MKCEVGKSITQCKQGGEVSGGEGGKEGVRWASDLQVRRELSTDCTIQPGHTAQPRSATTSPDPQVRRELSTDCTIQPGHTAQPRSATTSPCFTPVPNLAGLLGIDDYLLIVQYNQATRTASLCYHLPVLHPGAELGGFTRDRRLSTDCTIQPGHTAQPRSATTSRASPGRTCGFTRDRRVTCRSAASYLLIVQYNQATPHSLALLPPPRASPRAELGGFTGIDEPHGTASLCYHLPVLHPGAELGGFTGDRRVTCRSAASYLLIVQYNQATPHSLALLLPVLHPGAELGGFTRDRRVTCRSAASYLLIVQYNQATPHSLALLPPPRASPGAELAGLLGIDEDRRSAASYLLIVQYNQATPHSLALLPPPSASPRCRTWRVYWG